MPIDYKKLAEKHGGSSTNDYAGIAEKYGGAVQRMQKKTPEAIQQETQPLIQKGEEAKKYMESPWYKKLFSKQFTEEIPGATAKTLYEQPAKFAISAGETLPFFFGDQSQKGHATQKEYKLPGLEKPIKSFISEQETRAGELLEKPGKLSTGEELRLISPFAEVPLAGAEFGSILSGGKKLLQKGASFLSKKASQKLSKKALDDLVDLTGSVLKKKTSIQALERAGQPGGAQVKGLGLKIKVQPSKKDIEIAKSVQDVIDLKANPIRNLQKVNQEIVDVSENTVKPFLQQNPRAFNVATLESKLNKIEPPDIIKSDKTLQTTYDLIRNRMVDVVKKSKKTMGGLWDARKEFDKIVTDQFGDIVYNSEKNTAVKRGILDMRKTVNDFIGDSIGDSQFKDLMTRLSNMFIARHNIAEKSYKLLETTGAQRLLKGHPLFRKGLKVGGTAVGGALGYQALKTVKK